MVSLEATVRSAFAQRRKQLGNALGARWGSRQSQRALAAAGIDPRRRAETLSLDDFLRLHRAHRQSLRSSGD
jgi:16S rRNA (adenine1518-N6/adenine1519-N6)-dimethyltransferase